MTTSLITNFAAGFLGTLAEQKINKRDINPREAMKEGLISSIGDSLFGTSPLKGVKNAFFRGAFSGAVVTTINNYYNLINTPRKQENSKNYMGNLPLGAAMTLVIPNMRNDPRNECYGKSPFYNGRRYDLPSDSNSISNKDDGFIDFVADIALGAILGGL